MIKVKVINVDDQGRIKLAARLPWPPKAAAGRAVGAGWGGGGGQPASSHRGG